MVHVFLGEPLSFWQLPQEIEEVLSIHSARLVPVQVVEQIADLVLELFLKSGSRDQVRKGHERKAGYWIRGQAPAQLFQHRLWNFDLQFVEKLREALSTQEHTS